MELPENILIPITRDMNLPTNKLKIEALQTAIEESKVCPYLDPDTRTLADMHLMLAVLHRIQGNILDEIADRQYKHY